MSHQSDLPPHVPSCVSTGAGVTVPDATATRSDCAPKNFMTPEQCAEQFEMYAQSNPSTDSKHSLRFCAKFLREFCKQEDERELTSAKAEIARLNSHEGDLVIGCAIVEGARRQEARAVDRLEADSAALRAEVEQLRAQLRERTQWQCKCGGTDCAGQAENERLRAEVERLKAQDGFHWNIIKGCMDELEMVDMGPSMIRGEIQEWKCSHERLKAKEVAATDRAVVLQARVEKAEAELAVLLKEKQEWSKIYRTNYGHDWEARNNNYSKEGF